MKFMSVSAFELNEFLYNFHRKDILKNTLYLQIFFFICIKDVLNIQFQIFKI